MKQAGEIDEALREVAKLRDGLLRTAPALSSERRAELSKFLAVEFPVEAALREAGTRRDRSLNSHPPKMPVPMESALHRQLLAAEAARDGAPEWRSSHWRINDSIWRRVFRSPLGAALTTCAVITAAILCFGRWGTPPPRNAAESLPQVAGVSLESAVTLDRPSTGRADLFSRRVTIGPFNLHTNEPASLEASFVSTRRIQFGEGIETPLGLRLDLPLRATLMVDGLARTP